MIDNETKAKAALMWHLRDPKVLPGFVCLRHENRPGIEVGQADISSTGYKITTHLEVKLADPHVRSRGVQELKMLRLARAGNAYYVIYYDIKGHQETHIISPARMKDWPAVTDLNDGWTDRRWLTGFSHAFVSDFLRESHTLLGRRLL